MADFATASPPPQFTLSGKNFPWFLSCTNLSGYVHGERCLGCLISSDRFAHAGRVGVT
jgi:hypothetical protein